MRKKKGIIHRFYVESLSKLWQAIDQVCYTVKHVARVAKMVAECRDYVLVVRYNDSTGCLPKILKVHQTFVCTEQV